jgi:hypothetical protein
MKWAKDLTHDELVQLVDRVQRELFLEVVEDVENVENVETRVESWNFSKMHDYHDLLQHLADLLEEFGLAPE